MSVAPQQGRTRGAVGYAEVAEFYVAVARQRDPSLRHHPLLIGGDPNKRGKVVAASEDLRRLGIVDGMGLAEALDRAPQAVWARTDRQGAREVSGVLRAAVREVVPEVEVEGLAGFYMRAPASPERATEWAQRLETRVLDRTGLPIRLGVAPVRFAARLAAEDAGIAGARVVAADRFEDYLMALPLERLPGVGPKTAARLAELGAVDVPGLRRLGLERLDVLLGNHGRTLWLLACGEDPKPLRVKRHPDTLSREETLTTPTQGLPELTDTLRRLVNGLVGALRRDGLGASRVALRLTRGDQRTLTRSCSFEAPIAEAEALLEAALTLLGRAEASEQPIRRVGLVLKGLEARGQRERQLDLF